MDKTIKKELERLKFKLASGIKGKQYKETLKAYQELKLNKAS